MGGPELEVRLLIACAAAQNLATAHNTRMAHGPWGLEAGAGAGALALARAPSGTEC
jgi:hypothetical protein